MARDLTAFYQKKKELLDRKENTSRKKLEDVYHQKVSGTYLADIVFAANDGLITTFAVVAGSLGANLSPSVVLILGLANLLGDGMAMGFGNYLGNKSEKDYQNGQRLKEGWEIDNLRPIEEEEVREIMSKKGFAGKDLERAVEIITGNRQAWVDLMMSEELGITETGNSGSPIRHGLATFLSFFSIGVIPLIPFIFYFGHLKPVNLSIVLTAAALFTVGSLRSRLSPTVWWKGGLEMLAVGALSALAAFSVGKFFESFVRV